METIRNFNDIISRLHTAGRRKRVAMACPEDSHTEYVVRRALKEGLADFIFVCAGACSPEFDDIRALYPCNVGVETAATHDDAARRAVALVRNGEADVLMKGTINTDNLLRPILDKQCGLLRPGSVLSHVTVAEMPSYPKLVVFSDAAVIPRPTTEQFSEMLRYAVGVCRRIGIGSPRVALINCTEKVSEKFPHTLSYEVLKRQAADGLFGDALVDGPMDVKTACDAESGTIKGIVSPVVGNADVLIFPNIESGNVFYKAITLFAGAVTAGMLCGTTAPVVVASRADSCESKYYSLVLACSSLIKD